MIEVFCHAGSAAEAAAFLEAVGIARAGEDGTFAPIADVWITPPTIHETMPVGDVPGWHFNLVFHRDSAATLSKPAPEGGWLPEHDICDRTYILELVEGRTGAIPGWLANPDDPVPPGYAVGTVRAFDPQLVSTRSNVWQ